MNFYKEKEKGLDCLNVMNQLRELRDCQYLPKQLWGNIDKKGLGCHLEAIISVPTQYAIIVPCSTVNTSPKMFYKTVSKLKLKSSKFQIDM